MWFDSGSNEARLICPACGAVGNGLTATEDERPSYFCLTCLTRSVSAPSPARRPSLVERLSRLGGRGR